MPWLVLSQALLATVLVLGAGLLVRSLDALMRVDPGYRTEGVLTARVALPDTTYREPADVTQFHERLLERLRATPGVISVALATAPPAVGGNEQLLRIQDRPSTAGFDPVADLRGVTEDYLRTIGMPLRSGRAFTADDGPDAPFVAHVNETFVRRYFEGRSPLGARIGVDGPEWRTIVGVVADSHQDGVDLPPQPEVLVPMAQRRTRGPVILLRTTQPPSSMVQPLRAVLAEIDPRLPLGRVATLEALRNVALEQPKFRTTLLAAFAIAALLLVSLGIYGLTSYAVSRRAPEFGLRMALGATRGSIGGLVLASAGRLAVLGVAGGVLLAALAARAIGSLLFGVNAHDPLTFIAAPLIVLLVAVASALLPARRATQVDPMTTLRTD
jgi:putative ABC transport system permease protein